MIEGQAWVSKTVSSIAVSAIKEMAMRAAKIEDVGIVRASSFTMPKRQNRISRPLIFLHFPGPSERFDGRSKYLEFCSDNAGPGPDLLLSGARAPGALPNLVLSRDQSLHQGCASA